MRVVCGLPGVHVQRMITVHTRGLRLRRNGYRSAGRPAGAGPGSPVTRSKPVPLLLCRLPMRDAAAGRVPGPGNF